MSVAVPEAFGQRVDAVFGALGAVPHQDAGKQWSISRQQVFRAGRDDSSSDEGEPTEEPRHEHELLEPGDNVQIDQQGNIVQPSRAFCQALDYEQEYDEADAVAGTSLRGTADPTDLKPHHLTEVLDDNAFDRRMRAQVPAGPSRLWVTTEPRDTDMTDVLLARPSIHVRPLEARHRHQSLSRHQQPSRPGVGPLSGQGRHPRRSTVPDHVRNPDKYTCYVLDETLTVGGGDKGISSDGGRAELQKAARAASSAAARQMTVQRKEQPQDLPAFGAGIEFRPSKKRRQQTLQQDSAAAGANIQHSGLTEDNDEAGLDQDEDTHVIAQASRVAQKLVEAKPRRRQYRSKADPP